MTTPLLRMGAAVARSAPASADVDPFFSDVVLLMHMDGTNGSTSFIDSSSYGRTLTPANGAQLSTTQLKFGLSSGLFDGTNDVVTTPSSGSVPELELSNRDFTIEFWIRWASLAAGGQAPIGKYSSSTPNRAWFVNFNNAQVQFSYFNAGGSQTSFPVAWAPAINTWYHFALCRNGANLRYFVNGTQQGATQNIGAGAVRTTTETVKIGGEASSGFFNGFLDDLRWTMDVARYVANFTVPTRAFPNQ